MENLEGKFKSADPSRRKDATDDFRLSEVKTKLRHSAERVLQAHLSRVAGAKIIGSRVAKLDIVENATTGLPTLSGRVLTEVSFIDGKQIKVATVPVAILNGQPTVIADELKTALDAATVPAEASTNSSSTSVTASLSDFKVVDDGTRYLKIYHTAAYGDLEPIGAVSKDEYVTAADKGTLLSEMFKDEAVSWPAEVNFTGTFDEPAIVEKIATEAIQYKVKAVKSDEVPVVEAAAEDHSSFKFSQTDSTRFTMEASQKNYNDLKARIEQRAHSAFMDHCRTHQIGSVKIKNSTSSWDADSGVGEIKIEAEVLDGKDTKLVPFTVGINGSRMSLPDFSNLSAMLKEAKVVTHVVEGENIYKNINLEKDAALEKKALASTPQKQNYQEVLRLPKDFLPASLKEGDVISVDGLRWKLTSKSEGSLSNEKDSALYWLFEKVHAGSADGGKPNYRQESY